MKAKKDSLQTKKLDWNLLLEDLRPELKEVCEVLAHGAEKYGERNWTFGDDEFCYHLRAAIERHRNCMLEGEMIDKDSGKHHRAHIICSELFLLALEK